MTDRYLARDLTADERAKLTATLKLPPRFYHDHRERDLPETGISHIVREASRYVLVEMDAAALADLKSDAEFYSDPGIASDMGMSGLASSARATAKIIRDYEATR